MAAARIGCLVAKAVRPRRTRRKQEQQPGGAVAREAADILNKYITRGVRGDFFAHLGVQLAPVVSVLPSELPVLEVRTEQPDRLFRLATGAIAHAEFQMTSAAGDLRRFYDYQYAAAKEYETEVYTIVFYGPGIASAPDTLHCGSAVFTVRNVYIGQWDGEAVVAELREQVGRGRAVGAGLLTRLKLLPLMKLLRPLAEVVREVAQLTGALAKGEREETIGVMLGLGYNYLDSAIIDQLLKEPTVANALEQLVLDSLTRGKAEGREGRESRRAGRRESEGRREAILTVLAGRFGAAPESVQQQIAGTHDLALLQRLVTHAATAHSLEEFARLLAGASGG